MQLTGDQRRQLQQVLLGAFTTRAALEQLVSFTLNTKWRPASVIGARARNGPDAPTW